MKLNYKRTVFIGLGFFTVALVWSIYNVAVPLYLDDLKLSKFWVGAIMAIDNVFAMAFNPLFGNLSDKTRTRFGRRMPYLLIGIPLATVFFVMIPFMRFNLWTLMPTVIIMNVCMCLYRAPTVALMPDLTPPPLRSQANGVINLMGGIGTAVAMLAGAALFKVGESVPFAVVGGVMILTIVIMFIFVKEPKDAYKAEDKPKDEVHGKLEPAERRSLILILVAIFCWFVGYNGIETFLSIYGRAVLGVEKGVTSTLLLIFSGIFLLTAIPSGFIAKRIGRRVTIMIGLSVMLLLCVSMIFVKNIMFIYPLMALGGIGWACVNINSYPMVVQLAKKRVGTFTGYYYFFSMAAASVAPMAIGKLMDSVPKIKALVNVIPEQVIFPVAMVFFALAMLSMAFVKHGEAHQEEHGEDNSLLASLEDMD